MSVIWNLLFLGKISVNINLSKTESVRVKNLSANAGVKFIGRDCKLQDFIKREIWMALVFQTSMHQFIMSLGKLLNVNLNGSK